MMWLVLICASFFELAFTVCMKLSNGLKREIYRADGDMLLCEYRIAVCCDKNSAARRVLCRVDRIGNAVQCSVRHNRF